jgi:hypothetical protein
MEPPRIFWKSLVRSPSWFPESHALSFALIAYAFSLDEGAPPGRIFRRAPE